MAIPISNQIQDELYLAIEVLGVDNTIKALKDAKVNKLIIKDVNIDFIISTVSEKTGVARERILTGSDRTDERKIAVALCVYFIKSELLYCYGELRKIFNKHESALSRYNTLVENVSSKNKTEFDQKLYKYYEEIKNIISGKKIK